MRWIRTHRYRMMKYIFSHSYYKNGVKFTILVRWKKPHLFKIEFKRTEKRLKPICKKQIIRFFTKNRESEHKWVF